MIEKKIKNIELVTIALYEIGGARKFIDTEDIAVKADNIDDERSRHIWDLKVKNSKQFKIGHENLVKRLKKEFDGREVAMGSYDFNGPNGATHWVIISGLDMEDHLMLYDELQKQDDFYVLLSERGEVERVGDVELEMLIQLEGIVEN